MGRAIEFSARALEHVDDICAVAKVLSAHVRESRGGGLGREVVVCGRRLRFTVDAEQITVLEAGPVPFGDS